MCGFCLGEIFVAVLSNEGVRSLSFSSICLGFRVSGSPFCDSARPLLQFGPFPIEIQYFPAALGGFW